MRFDHNKFFIGFKAHFDSSLDQSQVDGIEFLLTQFEQEPLWDQVWKIAYGFATAFHETAGTMQPVEEGCYLAAQHSVAFMRRFQQSLRYYPYFGRGFVQLTWNTRRIPNYTRATRELKSQMPDLVAKFEAETGQTFDLVEHPEQALHPLVAFATMTLGMDQGWFTSKKLDDFDPTDYYDMRTIINGHDKATLIAGYAHHFEKILNDSLVSAAANVEGNGDAGIAPTPAGDPAPTASGSAVDEQSPTSEVKAPASLTDTPRPSIWERMSAWKEKIDTASSFKQSLNPFTPSISANSGTSGLSVVTTKAGGWIQVVHGIWTGNKIEIIVGAALVLGALAYLAIAKRNAAKRSAPTADAPVQQTNVEVKTT